MNKVFLMGRLSDDPDVRYTNSGKVCTQIKLAVSRPFAGPDGKKEADFIPCVFWGKSAETLGNSVIKGQRILLEGRMQIRSYEGKDGAKKYVTEVVADRFEFIEKKTTANTGENAANAGDFSGMGEEVPF